jgi:hypothetical protein
MSALPTIADGALVDLAWCISLLAAALALKTARIERSTALIKRKELGRATRSAVAHTPSDEDANEAARLLGTYVLNDACSSYIWEGPK